MMELKTTGVYLNYSLPRRVGANLELTTLSYPERLPREVPSLATSMTGQKMPGCTPFGSSSARLKTVNCILTTISSIARSAFVTPATGLPRAKPTGRWSPATACAITLPVVEHAVKQAPLPLHPDSAEAQSVSSPLSSSELQGEDASRYCPLCSQRLESRRCKLICNRCGYYMSCADYV